MEAAVVSICEEWQANPPALLSPQQAAWYLFREDDMTATRRVHRMMERGVISFISEGKRKWVPWFEIQRLLTGEVQDDDIDT